MWIMTQLRRERMRSILASKRFAAGVALVLGDFGIVGNRAFAL